MLQVRRRDPQSQRATKDLRSSPKKAGREEFTTEITKRKDRKTTKEEKESLGISQRRCRFRLS